MARSLFQEVALIRVVFTCFPLVVLIVYEFFYFDVKNRFPWYDIISDFI